MKKILLLGSSGQVGRALEKALREDYQVIPAAGHKRPEGGYCLPVEEPEKLLEVLEREEPEIVISAIRGDYQAQMRFHELLAEWLTEKEKRLLYVSTANVFDGNLSRPRMEEDPPEAESEYGVFKQECEAMLREKRGDQLIIFRLAAVWDRACPRARQLELHSRSGEAHHVWQGDAVNITLARQVGDYAKYVLGHDLRGIFHVGTTDVVDHFAFEKMACRALGIVPPEFEIEEVTPQAYQAVIPSRKEIPAEMQLTVAQVLEALRGGPLD